VPRREAVRRTVPRAMGRAVEGSTYCDSEGNSGVGLSVGWGFLRSAGWRTEGRFVGWEGEGLGFEDQGHGMVCVDEEGAEARRAS
jgi:hypothetical protein